MSDRDDILRRLAEARGDAQRIAEQQQVWRKQVGELLELGRAAGLTVSEMADALGLSKKWTEHLKVRAKGRLLGSPFFFGGRPPLLPPQ